MEGISRIAKLTVISVFAVSVAYNASIASVDNNAKTIAGMIIAAEWSDDGDVTAVAINVITDIENSDGESEEISEDYLVGDTEKGRELLTMVSEEVEATGLIKEDEDGNKTIMVSSYRVMEPAVDDEEGEGN